MKKTFLPILVLLFIATNCVAQTTQTTLTDSARNTICPLKVLQIVKSCAIAKNFPKGAKIVVGNFNLKRQFCAISVYIDNNGLVTNLYAMAYYPATKELFNMNEGKVPVTYDHSLDAEVTKYCW